MHYQKVRSLVSGLHFKRIIDIGCNDGSMTSLFLDCADDIIGIDKNEERLRMARDEVKGKNISFQLLDLEKEEIKGKYDLVIFTDVIYYLNKEAQDKIAENIAKILNDGGLLLTSRHATKGHAEMEKYSHLFENIKTEMEYKQPSVWCIGLWKKK